MRKSTADLLLSLLLSVKAKERMYLSLFRRVETRDETYRVLVKGLQTAQPRHLC